MYCLVGFNVALNNQKRLFEKQKYFVVVLPSDIGSLFAIGTFTKCVSATDITIAECFSIVVDYKIFYKYCKQPLSAQAAKTQAGSIGAWHLGGAVGQVWCKSKRSNPNKPLFHH